MNAIERATMGDSLANYPAIYNGLMSKGIPENEIKPRVNVFTLYIWNKLGRKVKKGETGVKIISWREIEDKEGGIYKRAEVSYVFHISQTEPRK